MRLCIIIATTTFVLPSLAAAEGASDVVARVGDRVITRAILDVEVKNALNSGYFHRRLTPEKEQALRKEQLDKLVQLQLDALGGLDRGLKPPLEEAARMAREIEEKLGKEGYEESIAALGWDRQAHQNALARTLLGTEARRRFVEEPATATEAEVRAAFDAEPDRWIVPESQRIWHILLGVTPNSPDTAWNDAETLAETIVQQLQEGTPFAELAQKHSTAGHRVKGGDLGWVHRGSLEEPVESAVWEASPGDLVGPLRNAMGVHIARVEERKEARQLSFDEAQKLVRARLERDRSLELEAEWSAATREKYPVEILDPKLAP